LSARLNTRVVRRNRATFAEDAAQRQTPGNWEAQEIERAMTARAAGQNTDPAKRASFDRDFRGGINWWSSTDLPAARHHA
jgi:hypothetical protein